jgi:hypothetical protein
LNSGFHTCKAGTLLLEPHLQSCRVSQFIFFYYKTAVSSSCSLEDEGEIMLSCSCSSPRRSKLDS